MRVLELGEGKLIHFTSSLVLFGMVVMVGGYYGLFRSSILIGHFLNLKKFLVGRLVDLLTWQVIGHN